MSDIIIHINSVYLWACDNRLPKDLTTTNEKDVNCPGCLANKPRDLEAETRKFMAAMGIDEENWWGRLGKLNEEYWERFHTVPGSVEEIKEHADVAIVALTIYLKARDELAALGIDPEIEMLTKMTEVLAR